MRSCCSPTPLPTSPPPPTPSHSYLCTPDISLTPAQQASSQYYRVRISLGACRHYMIRVIKPAHYLNLSLSCSCFQLRQDIILTKWVNLFCCWAIRAQCSDRVELAHLNKDDTPVYKPVDGERWFGLTASEVWSASIDSGYQGLEGSRWAPAGKISSVTLHHSIIWICKKQKKRLFAL